MRRVIIFGAAALGGIAAVLLVIWGAFGFRDPGLNGPATIAFVLGALFASLLGVGLMALIFYSDRNEVDEEVYRATLDATEEPGKRRRRPRTKHNS